MTTRFWKVIYRNKGKRGERCDDSASIFECAIAAAIELQWQGATILRILAPDGRPVAEDRYASIIWKNVAASATGESKRLIFCDAPRARASPQVPVATSEAAHR